MFERTVIGTESPVKLYYSGAGEVGCIALDIVGNDRGTVNAEKIAAALKLKRDTKALQWFMAIRFSVSPQTKLGASLLSRYDCGDWWCFECTLKMDEKFVSLSMGIGSDLTFYKKHDFMGLKMSNVRPDPRAARGFKNVKCKARPPRRARPPTPATFSGASTRPVAGFSDPW